MKNWTYEESGVTIEGGNKWVENISAMLASKPKDPSVVGGIGGFSGLYDIGNGQLLAACCDGVGTKLEIARAAGKVKGLGQDLVAMSVNDLVTCGARPLFFLDYLACGKLETKRLGPIVEGVADACTESMCALLGGETAEMPGVYEAEGFDLAGFAVGMIDREDLIDGSTIKKGDIVIGLKSSGIHSNGYSLVRSVLEKEMESSLNETFEELGETLSEAVLKPTKLYVKPALSAVKTGKIHGMAHITGGGLEENISRVIPEGLSLDIEYGNWTRPAIFDFISSRGVEEKEMRHVFNLGIGYVFIISPEDLKDLEIALEKAGEKAIKIGNIK